MSRVYERKMDDLVDVLKRANSNNIRVNLLIGAGVSVSGNIPLASEIINDIREKFPREYSMVENKTYAECMSILTALERRELISKYVDNAKINWAHMLIAHLLKKKIINCVLTTNFDNLLIRACALENSIPGVYDLAASNSFRPELLFNNSIIHLHGQHTGFVLCNTDNELERQIDRVEPTFIELNKNSMWIVIGYSGENDPILKLFHKYKNSDNRLYWVGFKNQEPNEDLKKLLEDRERYCYYIKGYDADSFFINLCKKLGKFPPDIIATPFTYLYNIIDGITEYVEEGLPFVKSESYNSMTKDIINKAISDYEEDNVVMAEYYFKLGLMDKFKKFNEQASEEDKIKIKKITDENKIGELIKGIKTYINDSEESDKTIDLKDIKLIFMLLVLLDEEDKYQYWCKLLNIIDTKLNKKEDNVEEIIVLRIGVLEELAKCDNSQSSLMDMLRVLEESDLEKLNKKRYIEIKIKAYRNLGKYFSNSDIEKAIDYFDLVLKEIEDNKGLLKNSYFNGIKGEMQIRKILCSEKYIIYIGTVFECIREIIDEYVDNEKNIEKDLKSKEISMTNLNILLSLILKVALKYEYNTYNNDIYVFLEEKLAGIKSVDIILLYLQRIESLVDDLEDVSNKDGLFKSFINIVKEIPKDIFKSKEIYDISIILNQVSYGLISRNENIYSKDILEHSIELDKNAYNCATLGYYYLRIEKNLGECIKQYDIAIDNEEDIVLRKAVEQKKEIELAKFLINEQNLKEAKIHINKAVDIGSLPNGWEVLYYEAQEIKSNLDEQIQPKEICDKSEEALINK